MDKARMNQVVDEFMAAMNEHDADKMAACCTPEIIADEVAEPEPFQGRQAFKQAYQDVFSGYPDCLAKVVERYVDDDNVICQVDWKATNTGVFRGAAPTGRPVQLRIAYFFHFRGDKIGRITEYYDLAGLLVQQGQLEL